MSALPSTSLSPTRVTHFGAASKRLKKLDWHTQLTFFAIKKAIREWKADRPDIQKVRPPRLWGRLPMKTLPFAEPDMSLVLPLQDEDWPPNKLTRTVVMGVLRSGILFPVWDRANAWVDPQEARDAFQEKLPLGAYMARPYHYWSDVGSDATMSRLAFAGLASLRLVLYKPAIGDAEFVANARWVSELGYLGAYEVRPKFERYGARAFFDEDQRPIAIFWCHAHKWVRPGDPEWAHAKWAWRSSLLVGTTLTDHLVGVHWLIANYVTTAARTTLAPTHWLRLLLKPFTWRTVTINASASETLCPEFGFVHRASALTYPALVKAYRDSVKLLRFRTVPQLIERKGAAGMGDRFPWATDALALYEVIRAFVVDYVAAYTTPDALAEDTQVELFWAHMQSAPPEVHFPGRSYESLIDVLAQFIWSVTGLHESVGTVHEYVLDPTFTSTKIRPGVEIADVQASMQALLVMALTGLDMPQLLDLGDANWIFGSDRRGTDAFARFHAALVTLSASIDEANVRRAADPDRPWPCDTFNPKRLEIGVSI